MFNNYKYLQLTGYHLISQMATGTIQGWVDCAWGIEKIGYVLVCYGVTDALASVSFGPIIRYVGRVPVFIFGGKFFNEGIIIVILFQQSLFF